MPNRRPYDGLPTDKKDKAAWKKWYSTDEGKQWLENYKEAEKKKFLSNGGYVDRWPSYYYTHAAAPFDETMKTAAYSNLKANTRGWWAKQMLSLKERPVVGSVVILLVMAALGGTGYGVYRVVTSAPKQHNGKGAAKGSKHQALAQPRGGRIAAIKVV